MAIAADKHCAIAAPPKMPRAPGGCHNGLAFVKMSGPIGASGVSERADSMGEWCSRGGGGVMRVLGILLVVAYSA